MSARPHNATLEALLRVRLFFAKNRGGVMARSMSQTREFDIRRAVEDLAESGVTPEDFFSVIRRCRSLGDFSAELEGMQ